MKEFNEQETIKAIDKYMEDMEKEVSNQPYKPFFTLYGKKRHWLNLLRYIFGEYKFRWFDENKQPPKYKNAFEIFISLIDLDVKDVKLKGNDERI